MARQSGVRVAGMCDQRHTCAYCGEPAETVDHVPPRVLFSRPYPPDMITVPSCLRCNRGFQQDDEYVGNAILMRGDIAFSPSLRGADDKAIRALRRAEARPMSSRLLSTVREVEISTASGIFLGSAWVFDIDKTRLASFLRRIIRGLFYIVFSKRVPDNHRVGASLTIDRDPELAASFNAALTGRPIVTACGGGFSYTWVEARDSPGSSVWMFSFHSKAVFAGLVVNPDEPSQQFVVE